MKLSIVVTAYNVQDYIERCLSSIKPLLQLDFELIIVDDGSVGSTPLIIDDFILDCPLRKIRLIRKPNGGLSSARNAGLKAVTGDYVIFVDGDDYIIPENLSEVCNGIDPDCEVTICSPEVSYEILSHLQESDSSYFKFPYKGRYSISELNLFSIPVVSWSKIYNYDFIKNKLAIS